MELTLFYLRRTVIQQGRPRNLIPWLEGDIPAFPDYSSSGSVSWAVLTKIQHYDGVNMFKSDTLVCMIYQLELLQK